MFLCRNQQWFIVCCVFDMKWNETQGFQLSVLVRTWLHWITNSNCSLTYKGHYIISFTNPLWSKTANFCTAIMQRLPFLWGKYWPCLVLSRTPLQLRWYTKASVDGTSFQVSCKGFINLGGTELHFVENKNVVNEAGNCYRRYKWTVGGYSLPDTLSALEDVRISVENLYTWMRGFLCFVLLVWQIQ